jgi:acetylornithine deacetylase/succinyl-diaminopimelate desuccinylase-like protein
MSPQRSSCPTSCRRLSGRDKFAAGPAFKIDLHQKLIMTRLDAVLRHLNNLLTGPGGFCELLTFASTGTDPAYGGQCIKAAEWLREQLAELGFDAAMRATGGQPVAIGKYMPAGRSRHAPHVLFYGHYDVQPPDPLELWEFPPFEPCIHPGADDETSIFAREASDDKGQLMTFLEASRAWLSVHGRFQCGTLRD